ncbi:piggyBac transposable element-derived protein 4-like [Vespula maculifrons]|uniref:PiggyBac transposable element-derived protein 4-like n=1 Tax=Vespula maculifrons TaxID=7453 RepID=A0ABD2BHL2_VESMC
METLKEVLQEINLSIGRRKIELVSILMEVDPLGRHTGFCNIMQKLGFKLIKPEEIVQSNSTVREIMNINANLLSINKIVTSPNLTVDEQLFPTKVRCKFTQYIVYISKPHKFGIKFRLASNVSKESRPSSIPFGEFVVLKIVESFTGCWKNIMTDNFFTSASLATKLLAKRTILFETIRKSEYLKQLHIITKPNSASMSLIKWQESTAQNQNVIDVQAFFNILDLAVMKYIKTTISTTNSRRAY